jgi:hypothetical protein
MRPKLASLVLAAVVLLVSSSLRNAGDPTVASPTWLVSLAPVFVFFGLLSIWLPPCFGAFTGPLFRGGYVDSPTPDIAFICFGYFLLAVPLISALYHVIAHATPAI